MGAAAGHSPIGPSGAKVWTECTSSVGYIAANEALLPPDDSSKYSIEGEKAHEVGAGCLRDPALTPAAPFTEVSHYVNICHARKAEFTGPRPVAGFTYVEIIEGDVPLFYSPGESGTIDYAIASGKGLAIVDLKWGAGVYVEEKDNLQLAIYARSLIRKMEEDDFVFDNDDTAIVSMTIVQPRCLRAGKPMAREWRITFAELYTFVMKVSDAVLAIKTDDRTKLKFAPSESNCQFCRARHIPCEAMRKAALAGLPVRARAVKTKEDLAKLLPDLDALSGKPGAVSNADLVEIFRASPLIRSYLSAVEDALRRRATADAVPGIKWVSGREGNRDWRDDVATQETLGPILGKSLYTEKMISPTQAEILVKKIMTRTELKSVFDPLIHREPAKPVLAVEEDPRPALPIAGAEDLADARLKGKVEKLPVMSLRPALTPLPITATEVMIEAEKERQAFRKMENDFRRAYEKVCLESTIKMTEMFLDSSLSPK
jgi:hypothetical protein